MKTLFAFARADARRSLLTLLCLVLAAAAEGVGISSLLPLLGLASQAGGAAPPSPPHGLRAAVLDALSRLGLTPSLDVLVVAVLVAMLLKGGLSLLAKRQVGYAVAGVTTDLRLRLLRALLSTRWSYFRRQALGSFSNAFATEATRAASAFLAGITMVAQALTVCVYVAVAFAVSWRLTLAAVGIGLMSAVALNGLVRMTREAGRARTLLLAEVMKRISDVFQGVKAIKVMGLEERVAPLLERATRQLDTALRRQVLTREAVATLQETLLALYVVLGIYLSVRFLGIELSAVFVLVLVFIRALTSLNKAQRQYQDLVTDESAYRSMLALVERAEAEHETSTGRRAVRLESALELCDVTFCYGDKRVFDRLSLTIPAGELTAVVGASGVGKTTLVDLVTALIAPRAGEIRIDGIPLPQLDLRAWRRQIGYVPQQVFLLHESVEVNVSLGDPGVSHSDVERALQAAGAWDFVQQLPEGLATNVGERGSRLSGGQIQRIAIARAMVRRPSLLILDEAAASLDRPTEQKVWEAMGSLRGQTTVLAISHRRGVLESADHVFRLVDGRAQPVPPGVARRDLATSVPTA